MKEQNLVTLILVTNILFLLYGISELSIRYEEADIFFNGTGFLHTLTNYFTSLFGQNDFALRLPFVLLHVSSMILIYKIGKFFLKNKIDRVISVGIYALLPGVNSAAILVNPASIVIFLTLLFIYFYITGLKKQAYLILAITIFFDNSFAVLYFALIFYAISKKENFLLILSLILFAIAMYVYGFDTGGKPRGYFLDTFGVYAAIFSPLLFLYFVYAMYRVLIKEERKLLWYISFTTLIFSLVLSLRQRLLIEDFAPFVVIAVPLMVRIFFNSYRVRLPIHRKYHNIAFSIVLVFLVLNFLTTVINKPLYYFMEDKKDHFAYKYHIAKELANALKKEGIYNIKANDLNLQLRLKFYGIHDGGIYELALSNRGKKDLKTVEIKYFGHEIGRYYLYR
ncbi:MAG TPA: hypothetical protein CFH82_00335 [Sulfurospirillum sp. UBA12182]|nr:MAG TPA: hypothetical protein CFH82_00335 [Sulfurospirillum sp. UBA12182]